MRLLSALIVALAWFSFGTAQARTITFDFVGDEPCTECPAGYATAKFVFETKRALHTTFWWSLFDITRGEVQADLEPTREYWKGMKSGDFNGFSLFDPSVTEHDLFIGQFSKGALFCRASILLAGGSMSKLDRTIFSLMPDRAARLG